MCTASMQLLFGPIASIPWVPPVLSPQFRVALKDVLTNDVKTALSSVRASAVRRDMRDSQATSTGGRSTTANLRHEDSVVIEDLVVTTAIHVEDTGSLTRSSPISTAAENQQGGGERKSQELRGVVTIQGLRANVVQAVEDLIRQSLDDASPLRRGLMTSSMQPMIRPVRTSTDARTRAHQHMMMERTDTHASAFDTNEVTSVAATLSHMIYTNRSYTVELFRVFQMNYHMVTGILLTVAVLFLFWWLIFMKSRSSGFNTGTRWLRPHTYSSNHSPLPGGKRRAVE
jgi:hypothetical protein